MNNQFLDVLIAKEYDVKQGETSERRVAWNRVGRAWKSKNGKSMSLELFMLPNHRYVIQLPEEPAKNG